MARAPSSHRRWPGGLVGTYALYLMRAGPIYGGQLTQRIDDVTRGAWRPGAGAVYPILTGLVTRGEARVDRINGRKVYAITPRGAVRLEEVRSRIRERGRRFGELRSLLLDMVEPSQRAEVMLDHLRRAIDAIAEVSHLPGGLPDARSRKRTIDRARAELQRGLRELAGPPSPFPARGRIG